MEEPFLCFFRLKFFSWFVSTKTDTFPLLEKGSFFLLLELLVLLTYRLHFCFLPQGHSLGQQYKFIDIQKHTHIILKYNRYMSKNVQCSFGSLGLLWMALPLFFVLYCPMAKYYSYSGPIDDVLLYLLFCILGYSEVQRQRLIFYDLTSVQHGTHHCLYILCYPYSKGELTLYYNLFCSEESTRECKLHSLSVKTCPILNC